MIAKEKYIFLKKIIKREKKLRKKTIKKILHK
jgi:hypothetical protein